MVRDSAICFDTVEIILMNQKALKDMTTALLIMKKAKQAVTDPADTRQELISRNRMSRRANMEMEVAICSESPMAS